MTIIIKEADVNGNFIDYMVEANKLMRQSRKLNFEGVRIPIPSKFNFEYLEKELEHYGDKQIIEFLHFRFPLSHNGKNRFKNYPKKS